jgi:hypothetical protein
MSNRRRMGKVVELKSQGMRARLREAHEKGALVRLWRGNLEAGSFTGYVAGIGREYFLMWTLGDWIGFDGLYALRHRDVTELEVPDANATFLEKAMAIKGLKPELPRDVPLDDVEQLVRAAALMKPVISVHVDTEGAQEVCYVGKLLGFEADGFLVQEIDPDANWLGESSFFGFDEVSAIALATPYNEALAMVAGEPPPNDVQPAPRGQVTH